jgi:hypothetical protein
MVRLSCLWVAVLLSLRAQQPPTPFLPAEQCASCHTLLMAPGDPARSIAPYALWSGSMMAHAAVDPFWKAQMRREEETNPTAKALIQTKCRACHAPMGTDEGVSCTVCHKIENTALGTKASFTAGFRINRNNQIYGPHRDPFTMPMRMHTGMTPAYGPHLLESSLCATCHTVITPTLDAQGKARGEFVEQAPYLEWLVSDFPREGKSCQSCHLPQLGEAAYIAHRPPGGPFPPTSPRRPYGLHTLIGGNYLAPVLMAEANPAEGDMLRRTSERAMESLESAVKLAIASEPAGDQIRIQVRVENRTGHKLPTGFPSRRMWLHLRVADRAGGVLFESGNPAEPIASQPHYAEIRSAGQTMVWEAEMADGAGNRTLSLLRSARYAKDNRILPRGFDLARWKVAGVAASGVAPAGTAGDADFLAGADTITYIVPAAGAHAVTAGIFFEVIKPGYYTHTGKPARIAAASQLLTR